MRPEKILILYDRDEEYANLMCEFLLGRKGLPWRVAACTSREDLVKICTGRCTDVLLAAASCADSIPRADIGKIIILDDGMGKYDGASVEKYQAAEDTLRGILELYSVDICEAEDPVVETTGEKAKLIGVFSPVRRCYQTTFSVLMGRLLSEKGRALYLSFEFCEGCEELIPPEGTKNLSDLMYFIKSPPSVFSLRFKSMVRTMAGLDYIPAAISGSDISEIPEEEWKIFLSRICVLEGYSHVILDLSESIRGIFGILRMCDRVYTLTRHDRVAKRKIESYENVLSMYEYTDIAEKSIKCTPPSVSRVPSISGDISGGEFADFIRDQIGNI